MANHIITNFCNAACEFCFASDARSRMLRAEKGMMDADEFRKGLDFAIKTGIKDLRLLGGEPTLHPLFADFVRAGREKGCAITVFSNGVMPDAALDVLAGLEPEICSVLINSSAAVRPAEKARQMETLKILGPRVSLGVTLTSADFSLRPQVEMIETFGLKRTIRVGISNPTWGGKNRALHPKHYAAVGQALFENSFLTSQREIELDADCGFVRCMFGESFEQLKQNGFQYTSRCAPVLDFCTGRIIIPCFGLSGVIQADLNQFNNTNEVFEFFQRKLQPYRSFGIYPECTNCPFFETKECSGGCLAARLQRLQPVHEP